MIIRLLPILLLLISSHANAARPFVTDDARLTNTGSCQLESWTRLYENSTEFWALPACNPFGNLELTLGAGIAHEGDAGTSKDYVAQLKTLFKPLETNGWGIGIAIGKVYHPEIKPGPNLLGNTYAYIPASFSFNDDKIIIHANLGALKDNQTHSLNTTFGIGGEYQITSKVLGIAEMFGDDRQKPFIQVGFRYSLIPNLFQLDSTLGQQVDGKSEDLWLSFGLRITPEKLF